MNNTEQKRRDKRGKKRWGFINHKAFKSNSITTGKLSQSYRHLIPTDCSQMGLRVNIRLSELRLHRLGKESRPIRSWLSFLAAAWHPGPGPLVGGSNGEVPAGVRDAKQERRYTSRGVPHKPGAGFICKGTPAVPLPVKPLCQRSPPNVTGSVTLSAPCSGSAGCLPCAPRTEPSSEQEEEGRK